MNSQKYTLHHLIFKKNLLIIKGSIYPVVKQLYTTSTRVSSQICKINIQSKLDSSTVRKLYVSARVMASSVELTQTHHEDLSSDHQHPCKKLGLRLSGWECSLHELEGLCLHPSKTHGWHSLTDRRIVWA